MKTRIKITELNSGEKKYYPQYNDDNIFDIIGAIIFAIVLTIISPSAWKCIYVWDPVCYEKDSVRFNVHERFTLEDAQKDIDNFLEMKKLDNEIKFRIKIKKIVKLKYP